jgi:hypothetical protein
MSDDPTHTEHILSLLEAEPQADGHPGLVPSMDMPQAVRRTTITLPAHPDSNTEVGCTLECVATMVGPDVTIEVTCSEPSCEIEYEHAITIIKSIV